MRKICPDCQQPMILERRPDDEPGYILACNCGYSETAAPDIEAQVEGRTRMPGL